VLIRFFAVYGSSVPFEEDNGVAVLDFCSNAFGFLSRMTLRAFEISFSFPGTFSHVRHLHFPLLHCVEDAKHWQYSLRQCDFLQVQPTEEGRGVTVGRLIGVTHGDVALLAELEEDSILLQCTKVLLFSDDVEEYCASV